VSSIYSIDPTSIPYLLRNPAGIVVCPLLVTLTFAGSIGLSQILLLSIPLSFFRVGTKPTAVTAAARPAREICVKPRTRSTLIRQ